MPELQVAVLGHPAQIKAPGSGRRVARVGNVSLLRGYASAVGSGELPFRTTSRATFNTSGMGYPLSGDDGIGWPFESPSVEGATGLEPASRESESRGLPLPHAPTAATVGSGRG
jgi:hypothetical protein